MQQKKDISPIFKAVAFDMDGLMFDTEAVYDKAATALLETRRGLSYTEELRENIMGRPPEYCFRKFIDYYSLNENWEDLREESNDLFIHFLKEGYSAMPGLFDLLEFLEKTKIPKAVCTSSVPRIMKAVLEPQNLIPRFDFIMTSEDIVQGKPNPEIYLKAAQKFNIQPENLLVFEDSVAGCQAARKANATCFVILADHNKNLDFSHASQVFHSLNDPAIFEHLSYPVKAE